LSRTGSKQEQAHVWTIRKRADQGTARRAGRGSADFAVFHRPSGFFVGIPDRADQNK
jgi:hypothetical protein